MVVTMSLAGWLKGQLSLVPTYLIAGLLYSQSLPTATKIGIQFRIPIFTIHIFHEIIQDYLPVAFLTASLIPSDVMVAPETESTLVL